MFFVLCFLFYLMRLETSKLDGGLFLRDFGAVSCVCVRQLLDLTYMSICIVPAAAFPLLALPSPSAVTWYILELECIDDIQHTCNIHTFAWTDWLPFPPRHTERWFCLMYRRI